MRALKRKAASQRGASITFSLLLFLVCAVISSVVIVAATAAAGRMSGLKESDQRYYAVTACARQLNEIFDGKKVALQYAVAADPDDAERKVVTVNSARAIDAEGALSDDEITGMLKDASESLVKKANGSEITAFTAQTIADPDPDSENDVACTVDETLSDDGRLEFVVSAAKAAEGGAAGSQAYTVTLTFASNLRQSAGNGESGTAIVEWKLLSARKNRAVAAAPAPTAGSTASEGGDAP